MARLSDAEAARWAGLYKPSRPFVTKRYGVCLGCGEQIREGSPARFLYWGGRAPGLLTHTTCQPPTPDTQETQ